MSHGRIGSPKVVTFPYAFDTTRPVDEISIELRGFKNSVFHAVYGCRTWHEPQLLEYIARNAPRGGLYVDIGSNIGGHAVYFGKYLAGHVLCCEPWPVAAAALRRNLATNGVRNATVRECGVGAVPDSRQVQGGNGRLLTTNTRTVDELVAEVDVEPVNAIKIDTDGMDLEVLVGAEQTITTHRPFIAVEAAFPELRRDIPSLMEHWGYELAARFFSAPVFCYRPTR